LSTPSPTYPTGAMPNLSHLPANLAAGLLLAAIPHLNRLDLPAPTASQVFEATVASRTTAYKVRGALNDALPGLLRPPGRPRADEPEPVANPSDLHQRVLRFVFDNPGCVTGSQLRRTYADCYRVFVLDLFTERHDVPLTQLAEIVGVPLPTLKDWVRGDRPQVEAPETLATPSAGPSVAHIETILDAYSRWKGSFQAFCKHVQFHCRIPLGRQHISDILAAHGIRIPRSRRRPPDASALRGGFDAFFGSAQWIGDGTELVVEINGQRYVCNLELNVDVATGAFVGASLRPTEDSAAVVEALSDGVNTAGAPPLAPAGPTAGQQAVQPHRRGHRRPGQYDQAASPPVHGHRQAARGRRLRSVRPGGPAPVHHGHRPGRARRRDRSAGRHHLGSRGEPSTPRRSRRTQPRPTVPKRSPHPRGDRARPGTVRRAARHPGARPANPRAQGRSRRPRRPRRRVPPPGPR